MDSWKLFYDGGCNMCHWSQLRVERWSRAIGQPLRIDVLQNEEAKGKGYSDQMTLEADGKVYRGFEAWLRLMRISP